MGLDVITKEKNMGVHVAVATDVCVNAPADRACHSAGIAAHSPTSGLGPRTLPWSMVHGLMLRWSHGDGRRLEE